MKRSPLIIIFLTLFIDLLGFGIIIPVLPVYARLFGATSFDLGCLLASFSIMQFIFSPILGRLSDKHGRKPVLAISMLGTAFASFLSAISNSFGGFYLLMFSRIIDGITGGNISTAQAYVADVTPPEKRAMGMAIIGMGFGLGFILGPFIGGELSHRFGVSAPFYVVSLMALCNTFAMLKFLPEPSRHTIAVDSSKSRLYWVYEGFRRKETAIPISMFFLVSFAFSNMEATFALLMLDRFSLNNAEVGRIFAFIGVISIIVQGGLIRRLAPKYGEQLLIVFGIFCLSGSFFGLAFVLEWSLLLVSVAFMSMGQAFANPSLMAMVSKLTSRENQGSTLGVSQSLSSLGRVLGPLFGGYLYVALGKESPYYIGGVILFLAGILSIYYAYSVKDTKNIEHV